MNSTSPRSPAVQKRLVVINENMLGIIYSNNHITAFILEVRHGFGKSSPVSSRHDSYPLAVSRIPGVPTAQWPNGAPVLSMSDHRPATLTDLQNFRVNVDSMRTDPAFIDFPTV